MDILQTRALTKAYGRTRALDALDMRVDHGDIYGFVGKNGAGKSTLMKIASGLAAPTSGEIELFGVSSQAGSPFSTAFSRVGALIEDPGLLPSHSAYENLMCKALALGVVRAPDQCRDLLRLVGLEDAGTRAAKKLSLGMRQRLGLALALVGGPDLLLLDEPFNGMDPEATRTMRNALMRLNRERGVTMVISSHVLDQLDRMATRFGVIRAGSMVREFSVDELHGSCTSSIRVKTADTARALAILEERLAGATFRAEPDGAILISMGRRAVQSVAPEPIPLIDPGTAAGQGATPDALTAPSVTETPATATIPAAQRGTTATCSMNTSSTPLPSTEHISRILHEANQIVLELTVLERDIEDYFVELMGASEQETQGAPQDDAKRDAMRKQDASRRFPWTR